MTSEILLNVESKQRRAAHLRNGQLQNLTVERKKERQLTGNIYRGRVTNTLPNIQSAFINIGELDNGFIHILDIEENKKKFEQMFDMDFDLDESAVAAAKKKSSPTRPVTIESVLKIGQPVIVQVVKEPIGNKGARLTSNLSIAGRYLVLLPNSSHRGVSRKIEDPGARDRLKRLIRSFEMPKDMGLICRTACHEADSEMLINEAHELLGIWEQIITNFHLAQDPCLLYSESDLVKRSLLTAIDHHYDRILVDDYDTYQTCKNLYNKFGGNAPIRIELYRDDKVPMFERFNIEREIERSLRRKIWLPSGGYLYFDRTEAMHTIDVNSGRSNQGENNVEESLVAINLEAAEEIARQLRIRNIGGLIICDFIDMRLRRNQKRVLEKMKECMREDSAKCTILGMSEFGLVEMTRQRHRGSLQQMIFCPCPYCTGEGRIKNHESVSIEIERALKKAVKIHQHYALKLVVHPQLDQYLNAIDKEHFRKLAELMNASLQFTIDDRLHLNDFHFLSATSGQVIEI